MKEISANRQVRDRFILTAHFVADIQRAVDRMCDIHQSPSVVLDDDKHCRHDVDVPLLIAAYDKSIRN